MPGRVRCSECGAIWPGLARFCGHCGTVLRTVEEYSALDPIAEERNRPRRRLMRALVLIIAVLIIVALATTWAGPEAGPEAPPEDPLLDPQVQPNSPVGA